MPKYKVLVIEDEPAVRFGMRDFLERQGYDVLEADSCRKAQETFRVSRPDAAIVDYMLIDGNALDLLPRLKEIDSDVPLLVLTAHASIDLAVRAVKEGAEQFLTKPVELATLAVILQRIFENQRNQKKQLASQSRESRSEVNPFVGTSSVIKDLEEQARKLAMSESPLLIQGETGTGKSVLARWMHDHSPRSQEPFVDLNCAGFSKEFLETELFGHEKGAFTGAVASKSGLLEVAHRGTVFLDEIGDMDPQVQPKMLKVLEEKRFRRLGEVRDRQVDIRLVAATHQNLSKLVHDKLFRSDLYFRISTIPFLVPSLRDRVVDIPVLAQTLLLKIQADMGRAPIEIEPAAQKALMEYLWPGNIRELRNVLERAVLLATNNRIERKNLMFASSQQGAADLSLENPVTLEELERLYIEKVLRGEQGRVEAAAVRLGIPRSSLYQKLKKFNIAVPRS